MRSQRSRRVLAGAAAILALAGSVGGAAPGAARPASRARPRAPRPRASPVCALDLAECLGSFVSSGNLGCVAQATVGDALPTRAVVDDVVAGLTGGFVGVAGSIVFLELGKLRATEALKCTYCAGKGELKCGQCFGEGCAACGGTGRVKCVSCGGSGRAVSSDVEKEQFRAIFGLFPEMRYGPEAQRFDERLDELEEAPAGLGRDEPAPGGEREGAPPPPPQGAPAEPVPRREATARQPAHAGGGDGGGGDGA